MRAHHDHTGPERVVCFAPHAGIWVHSFPEALVAKSLQQAGASVCFVGCDGAFSSFCIPMSAQGLHADSPRADKLTVCAACRRNRSALRFGVGLSGYVLDEVLGPAEEERVRTIVRTADRNAIEELAVDGLPVGRVAAYEYLLHKKRSRAVFTEAEWIAFVPRLENTLRSFFAAQRILERERATRLVLYNSLYSVNAAWRLVADRMDIPVYFIHAGLSLAHRLNAIMLGRDSTLRWFYRLMDTWPRWRDLPCAEADLAKVTDHFVEVLAGTNVFAYSQPKSGSTRDWRNNLGVRVGTPLLVATMSSYDEYVAARTLGEQPSEDGLLFPTQIEWVRALVDWMRTHPERTLLIRVHPREFPNKREGVKSEHAQMLEQALTDLPSNVVMNWPADGISLYDIAEHADVFLNAWSSVGKEMSLLGLPVVIYCPPLVQYPSDLNYVGTTRETYFAAIEAALRDGWSFENIRRVYRWGVVEYVRALIDIEDGFDYSEVVHTLPQRARNLVFAAPGVRQAYDLVRRPRVLRAQQRIADLVLSGAATLLDLPSPPEESSAGASVDLGTETAALRRQVRRLADALYRNASGPPRPGSLRAHLLSAASASP